MTSQNQSFEQKLILMIKQKIIHNIQLIFTRTMIKFLKEAHIISAVSTNEISNPRFLNPLDFWPTIRRRHCETQFTFQSSPNLAALGNLTKRIENE